MTDSVYRDLELEFRPQRVWAEGRAFALVLAHALSGAGAGAWLLGLLFDARLVCLLGLILVVVGGVVHLGFLGHPLRAWAMLRRPQSSWISRGLWFMVVFVPASVLYVASLYGAYDDGSAFAVAMLVLSLAGAAGIFLYKGFVYAVAKAVPLWHSPLLPLIYIAIGLRGGAAVALIALPWSQGLGDQPQAWWLATTAVVAACLGAELALGSGEVVLRRSFAVFLRGSAAWVFWMGFVALGVLVPLALVTLSYSSATAALTVTAGVLSLVGDLSYKYCMNSGGIFTPLIR
jgi:formate-dependent nitrite reductase membrane component NrfD